MLETAVTGGVGATMAGLSLDNIAIAAFKVGTAAVATQFIEMRMGTRTKFDPKAVLTQLAALAAGMGINAFTQSLGATPLATVARSGIKTFTNAFLGARITGNSPGFQQLVAEAIGNAVTDTTASNLASGPYTSQEMEEAEAAVHMKLPGPKLDIKSMSYQTDPVTQGMSELAQEQMAAQKQRKIYDVTAGQLGFFADMTKGTLAGSALSGVQTIRNDLRSLVYGDLDQKIVGLQDLATDTLAIAAAEVGGGLVFNAAKGLGNLISKGGLFSGTRGESAETLANRAMSRVKLAQEDFSATSPNAAEALSRKYRALEGAQNGTVKTEILSDGRIIYYEKEKLARNPGPTRGTSYVTEYNPNTGDVYTWMESYDHFGNVNRIHPKMYNGQTLNSPHYPPTLKDKLEPEYYSGYRR